MGSQNIRIFVPMLQENSKLCLVARCERQGHKGFLITEGEISWYCRSKRHVKYVILFYFENQNQLRTY